LFVEHAIGNINVALFVKLI